MFSIRSFTATALLAGVSLAQDCVLTVPANPLSAAGLATPYTVAGCDQRAPDMTSFVECAIYDGNGAITVYHPLIVNAGDKVGTDFVQPIPATVPQGATTACWFGTNGNSLTLTGGSAGCVNGLGKSIFGQFASCGGDKFMQTTIAAATAGKLQIPAIGSGVGGQCPSTRDFRIVDQDQSDNVVSTYLLNGRVLSQNTPAASTANKNATVLANGSDNGLLVNFIDPVLGCVPWTADSQTAPSGKTPALALNELQANAEPPVGGAAFVPLNDPMVVIGTASSLEKTNLYRAAVGQPLAKTAADASGTVYCKNFLSSGIFIQGNKQLFTGKASPAPDVAVDLYTFLAQRFAASLGPDNLGCLALFNLAQPVTMTMDGNMVVTSANINTASLQAIINGASPSGNVTVSTANPTSTPNSSNPPLATVTSRRTRKTRHWTSRPASISAPGTAAGAPTTTASASASLKPVSLPSATLTPTSSVAAGGKPVLSASSAPPKPTVSASASVGASKVSSLMSSYLSSVASGIKANPSSSLPIQTLVTNIILSSSSAIAGGAKTSLVPTTMATLTSPAAPPAASSAAACSFTKDARGLVFDGTQFYFPVPPEFAKFLGN